MELIEHILSQNMLKEAIRRVYIPKANSKKRPLGYQRSLIE